jgi:hypothetical protein
MWDRDHDGLIKADILDQMKERRKEIKTLTRDCVALFGVLWGQLSDSSIQAVTQHPDFTASNVAQNRDDPLILWRIITATHVTTGTGQDDYDKLNAKKGYAMMKQGANESLVSFKDRYDNAINGLALRQITLPSDREQALEFIDKLDPIRYSGLQVHTKNMAIDNLMPESLTEAYRKAMTFVVAVPRYTKQGGDAVQTVFITTADKNKAKFNNNTNNNKQSQSTRNNNKAYSHNNNNNNRSSSNRNTNKQNKKTKNTGCYICNSADHWSSKCPHLGACQQLISNRKNTNHND